MKVLFLGNKDSPLIRYIRSLGDEVLVANDKINPDFIRKHGVEFIVSYGYRHILKPDVISTLPDKIINLHIGLLPWNKGADPNFWSFAENTPKGVTIHYIDAGVDTGDIITQKELTFSEGETLASSYRKLQIQIQSLFRQYWPNIRQGICRRRPQPQGGTYHRLSDKESLTDILTNGWDTPVAKIISCLKNK